MGGSVGDGMAKVKKSGDVTSLRGTNAKGRRRAPNGASGNATKAKKPARTGIGSGKRKGIERVKEVPKAPTISYRVRRLDPLEMCGRRTTVEHLYRVDEVVDGAAHAHLVFFDRHGWYCEHGPNCPAVVQARKFDEAHA
jgi:hypothetical protein